MTLTATFTPTFTETPIPPTATFTEAPTETPVPPTAAFMVQTTSDPLTFQFINQSTGAVGSVVWDFGDGTTSSEANPVHTYAAPDDYTVVLAVISADSITSDSETQTVSIAPPTATPEPTATLEPVVALFTFAAADNPLAFQFSSQSTGAIANLVWDFGDGTTSSETNPVHTYAAPGDYPVTLTVMSADGITSDTETQTVSIAPPTATLEPVMALFTFAPAADNPLAFQFSSQSTGAIANLLWDFGDGTTSSETNPVHTYAAPGDYAVTLTVMSADGSTSDAETQTVSIAPPTATPEPTATLEPVVALFTFAPLADNPLAFQFSSQSTGAITNLLWDFGDGTTSSETNPVHTYAAPGDYPVTLTAISADGITSDTETQTVSIAPPTATPEPAATLEPLAADFTFTSAVDDPLTLQFSNQSTGPISSLQWDFGDGTNSTEVDPVHTYGAAGDYLVTLTITAPDGVTTETTAQTVTVEAQSQATPEPVLTLNAFAGQVNAAVWDPSGITIAAANEDGTITLWDSLSGQSISTLSGHTAEVIALDWQPNGSLLASASVDGVILLWDMNTSQPMVTYQNSSEVTDLRWSPNGALLAVAGTDGSVILLDPAGNAAPLTQAASVVNALAWSPDSAYLLVGVDDGSILLINMGTGQVETTLTAQSSVTAAVWSPDNQRFVTGQADGSITTWTVGSEQPVFIPTDQGTEAVTALAWHPTLEQLVSGDASGTLRLWEVETGTLLQGVTVHTDTITAVAWNGSGTQYLSASDDGTVLIWQP